MKTTNRIIINSYGIDDETACLLVHKSIKQGKISDEWKQYCYVTVYELANNERIVLSARQRGNTSIFTLYKE